MLKLKISGVHTTVDESIKRYVIKKIGKLDKYIPRKARGSAHAEVFLKESKHQNKKECTCEIVVHLPQDTFTTKESTINIFAAVDIVEAKLKNQLHKYKELHLPSRSIPVKFLRYLKSNSNKTLK
ncbi:MAG TPA: ribosome-associated translation inhibitor RaiA [Candidatus Saccharimonadia bacterium]|nr:ribosome-associated translation inhibitor RaiA [Candidatus Saccharimonadia bacterium]